jgi:hypothetical protein
MIKEFDAYRIITNGKKYRIEGRYTIRPNSPTGFSTLSEERWILLSNGYYGCDSYGYLSILGGVFEFNSKKEAIDFIRKEYGECGLRKLEEVWRPA